MSLTAAPPRIGNYQLVRELARGGMGTVWLARRADQQFEKLVAIKLLKRGTDTDEVLRRFQTERQILARLEHPNIAPFTRRRDHTRGPALLRDGIRRGAPGH